MPFERPAQFGTRQFLTDEEHDKRLEDVRVRDDIAEVSCYPDLNEHMPSTKSNVGDAH